jgi:nitrogen regulatory protein PII 2
MKQIVALIRQQRFNRTRTALADAGFSSFTARKVVGRGRSDVVAAAAAVGGARVEHGAGVAMLSEGSTLLPRRMLTVVVKDDDADVAIRTIIGVNKTGVPGDGKIFVLPVHEASRVRTREHGTEALRER